MARALLLKRPNPFAFPGGSPGFDPSHVAAPSTQMSCVGINGNFINILSGSIGSVLGGAPAATIHGSLGPAVSLNNTTDSVNLPGKGPIKIATGNSYTLAAIVVPNDTAAFHSFFCIGGNSTNSSMIVSNSGGLTLNIQGGSFLDSGNHLVSGVPYFVAISVEASVATYFVVTNLRTGAVKTVVGAAVTCPNTSPDGGYVFGKNTISGQSPMNGLVAAAMASSTAMTLPQMLAWAQDPWAFWYPQKLDLSAMLKVASGGATYTLTAAQGTFVLNGIAATLNSARSLIAAKGTYAVNGIAAAFNRGIGMPAAQGAFIVSGIAANRGISMSAAKGSYVVNGIAAGLFRGRTVTAAQGSFTVNGIAASFPVALSIKPVTGVYTINGISVVLAYSPAGGGGGTLPHSLPFFATVGALTTK